MPLATSAVPVASLRCTLAPACSCVNASTYGSSIRGSPPNTRNPAVLTRTPSGAHDNHVCCRTILSDLKSSSSVLADKLSPHKRHHCHACTGNLDIRSKALARAQRTKTACKQTEHQLNSEGKVTLDRPSHPVRPHRVDLDTRRHQDRAGTRLASPGVYRITKDGAARTLCKQDSGAPGPCVPLVAKSASF